MLAYPEVKSHLPGSLFPDLVSSLETIRRESERITVVLDDDPTGCQTVYGVTVLLKWDKDLLQAEFRGDRHLLFILTNSRSLDQEGATTLYRDIGKNLQKTSEITGRPFTIISRSDSTLRGHYPAEPESLHFLFDKAPVQCIIPAFFQGGRVTVDDIHYVVQGDEMIPAADTPFARDRVFGFRHSDLKQWVAEKTGGKIGQGNVFSFGLEDLRTKGPEYVEKSLLELKPGSVTIVNAITQNDLDIFALGALKAESKGLQIIYRTAASFINSYCAIEPVDPLGSAELVTGSSTGGIIIAGSYVPKTTAQLKKLRAGSVIHSIEIDVRKVLDPEGLPERNRITGEDNVKQVPVKDYLPGNKKLMEEIDKLLSSGKDVLIYTSRDQVFSGRESENIQIGKSISNFLAETVGGLKSQPSFIVAKGGITSHDIASEGLQVTRAIVAGQALPGVPVWSIPASQDGEKIKYIIFPGNVGDEETLLQLYRKLKSF